MKLKLTTVAGKLRAATFAYLRKIVAFVTETNEAKWEDCAWAVALMLANALTGGRLPDTKAEREALRAASGDKVGGSTLEQVAAAILKRYRLVVSFANTSDWTVIRGRGQTGFVFQFAGVYARLGKPYTRWDQAFANSKDGGLHSIFALMYDPVRRSWWIMDPLARGKNWTGEWIPDAFVKAYCDGMKGVRGNNTYYALQGDVPDPTL